MNYIVFDGSKDTSCAKCRFRLGDVCVVTGEKRLYQICPIRTLPDEYKTSLDTDLFEQGYTRGWNDCLKEINH